MSVVFYYPCDEIYTDYILLYLLFSYKIMLDCWNTDSSKRPTFSDLVVFFNMMLEQIAGYVDLTALQSEVCGDAGEEKLHATCLESNETETDPHIPNLNQSSQDIVCESQLTVDDGEPSERYVTTPV